MKVAVSGHRWLKWPEDMQIIEQKMIGYVHDPEVEQIFFGGAGGADTDALRYALEHRQNRFPKLTVIVPNTLDWQPVSAQLWSVRADELIELKAHITENDHYLSYELRNRRLVDEIVACGQLTAFWSGRPSGTYNAIKYAQSIGACWEHVPVHGRER